jgi:integrase
VAGRRRGRGEGSIYRRKDGRWVGQYEVNGKRRYVYGRTRKEIAQKLNRAIVERDAGLFYDCENLTLAEYLDRWLDSIRGTLAPRTVRRHEELTRIHIKPAIGKVKLSKLSPLQVQSLYRRKLDDGLSAATVVKIHSTLSKSLKQAVRWRLIPLNICASVSPPRITRTEIEPLDARQMKALLKAAEGTDLYALWVLLATTGLRIGEALALQWDDLDFEARTLRVNRTVFRGQVSQPKTSSSRRTIKLSRLAVGALRHHQRKGAFVFSTSSGRSINASNVRNRSWKTLLQKADLPQSTRLHDLRHSTATLMLTRGVPVKVVSEMLGHADVSITLSIYAHVLPDMQDGAADAVDDALS